MTEDKVEIKPVHNWIVCIKKYLDNKYIRSIMLILLLSFAAYQLVISSPQIITFFKENDIHWHTLILALSLTMVSVILGILLWAVLLRGMNYRINFLSAARTQVFSSLAKYIPGYVWQFTGKTLMSKNVGIPLHISILGFGSEVALTIMVGLTILFLLFPASGLANRISHQLTYNAVLFLGIVIIIATIFSPIMVKIVVSRNFNKYHYVIDLSWWYLAIAIIFIGWGLLSCAFYLTAKSLGTIELTISRSAIIISASYISGLIAFFAPNGIVVREAVMVNLFPVGINQLGGLVIGIMMRLETIAAELILGLIVLILTLMANKKEGRSVK